MLVMFYFINLTVDTWECILLFFFKLYIHILCIFCMHNIVYNLNI